MHHWRLSRYDPAKRDADGFVDPAAWTSVDDVASGEDGPLAHEYEEVETAYVIAAMRFAHEAGVEELLVANLEFSSRLPVPSSVPLSDLGWFVRAVLRGEMVCTLGDLDGQFRITFAPDLYMFVASNQSSEATMAWLEGQSVLFAEYGLSNAYYESDEVPN